MRAAEDTMSDPSRTAGIKVTPSQWTNRVLKSKVARVAYHLVEYIFGLVEF